MTNRNRKNKENQEEVIGGTRKTSKLATCGNVRVSGEVTESMKRVIGGIYDKEKYGIS